MEESKTTFNVYVLGESYPETVYRFRPSGPNYFDEELSAAIDRREVRFSPVKDLNDPFESLPSYQENTIREVRKYLGDFERRFGKGVAVDGTNLVAIGERNEFDPRLAHTCTGDRVSAAKWCLKKAPDIAKRFLNSTCSVSYCLNWDSILMWSHYCRGHHGVCLEYEVDIGLMKESTQGLEPMIYQRQRPTVTTVDLLKYEGLKLAANAPDFFDLNELYDIYRRLVAIKASDWEYENEWRITKFPLQEPKYICIPSLTVKSIIIGSKAPRDLREKVLAKYATKLTIYEVVLDPSSFSLIRERLNT